MFLLLRRTALRILIIEDNSEIASNLSDYLEAKGFGTQVARDGAQGLKLATQQLFDAILLDLSLPELDGFSVCRMLREDVGADMPILILSARDALQDKLHAFQSGADDFVVKPFSLEEVAARLIALNKRHTGKVVEHTLETGDLSFDPRTKQAVFAGQPVVLPPKAVRLLQILIGRPGRIFSREELEQLLWGEAQATSDRLRRVMYLLRNELSAAGGRDPIKTIHGRGYRLELDNH